MSDIQQAIRQFGDMVKDAEERQANHLAEVRDGIRATGNDFRRRLRTQVTRMEKAQAQFIQALAEVKIILDEAETADNHIMAEIETIRNVALAPAQIEHQQKETDNGEGD